MERHPAKSRQAYEDEEAADPFLNPEEWVMISKNGDENDHDDHDDQVDPDGQVDHGGQIDLGGQIDRDGQVDRDDQADHDHDHQDEKHDPLNGSIVVDTEPSEVPDPFYREALRNQLIVVAVIFILTVGCGMPIGYSSVLLPQILGTNSTFLTTIEMGSWIASIHSAASPCGSLLSGPLMDAWGRLLILKLSTIPAVIGWLIIATAPGHSALLFGRILTGFSVGLSAAPCQILLGEVSAPRIRGLMTGAPFVSYSLGILVIFAMGHALDWRTVSVLASIFPILAFLALFKLPESPHWLIRQGRGVEALKGLIWLRGGNKNVAQRELDELENRYLEEVTEAIRTKSHRPTTWYNRWMNSPLLSRTVMRPLAIINVFNVLQIFSGTFLIIFYASDVIDVDSFEDMAVVITAFVRFVMCFVACFLLLKVNRRTLVFISGIGTSIAAVTLGFWEFFAPASSPATWIPAALILNYVIFNTVGFFVIPGLVVGELLPARARGTAGGLTFTIFNLTLFATTKVYPEFASILQPSGVYWTFGISGAIATLVAYLFLPETFGRTLAEIEDYFSGNHIFWMHRRNRGARVNVNTEEEHVGDSRPQ